MAFFKTIVNDILVKRQLTELALGEEIGVDHSTINRIRHGQWPSAKTGEALLKRRRRNGERRAE